MEAYLLPSLEELHQAADPMVKKAVSSYLYVQLNCLVLNYAFLHFD